jgi:hypothetical protein
MGSQLCSHSEAAPASPVRDIVQFQSVKPMISGKILTNDKPSRRDAGAPRTRPIDTANIKVHFDIGIWLLPTVFFRAVMIHAPMQR